VQGATTGFPVHPNLLSVPLSGRLLLLDRDQRLGRYRVLSRLAANVFGGMLQTETGVNVMIIIFYDFSKIRREKWLFSRKPMLRSFFSAQIAVI
jgi:hypothetical protein